MVAGASVEVALASLVGNEDVGELLRVEDVVEDELELELLLLVVVVPLVELEPELLLLVVVVVVPLIELIRKLLLIIVPLVELGALIFVLIVGVFKLLGVAVKLTNRLGLLRVVAINPLAVEKTMVARLLAVPHPNWK